MQTRPLIWTLSLLFTLAGCASESDSKDEQVDTGTPADSGVEDTGEAPEEEDTDSGDTEEPVDTGTETRTEADSYVGNLEIVMQTKYGEDRCTGSTRITIETDWSIDGTGTCNFTILGSQTPVFSGVSTRDGVADGNVKLSAFGSEFNLPWSGEWSDEGLLCDHDGTAELDMIGEVGYQIRFALDPR